MSNKKLSRLMALAFGLGLIMVVALLYLLWTQLYGFESNDMVDISWTRSGKRNFITFVVLDSTGSPLPGVYVRMYDMSGGGGGETDVMGEWSYQPDDELLKFELNDTLVMKERFFLFAPSPGERGLTVKVIVKDPERLGIRIPRKGN